MNGGCYRWIAVQPVQFGDDHKHSRDSEPALSGVNISVRLGELVCVCGKVRRYFIVSLQPRFGSQCLFVGLHAAFLC